jgi:3-deoxy-D-manno-octulosonic-acid transferase
MTRQLYSFLMWLAQPLVRRKLLRRGVQEPGYLEAVAERFGRYTGQPVPPHGHTAAVLVARLRERLPGMRLLLTHGTATGRAEGVSLLQPGDIQAWQPWDTPAAVRRFLMQFKPRIGILMETEIWPNLIARCAQAGVPLVLANARMSDKSQRQASRLGWLSRPAFAGLTAVWAQTQADARHLTQLGAKVQGVFGNLKFDATPNVDQLATGRAWRCRAGRPVVLFASSREGEEETLLQVLTSSRTRALANKGLAAIDSGAYGIQWLIVPRHPQRFDEVAALIAAHGFIASRRSTWHDGPATGEGADAGAIWLGDSLGEMALYYGLADVALLGGSFEPLGGQNLIEAATCACPVVMGPHTFNFAEAADLAQAAGAALRVNTLQQAVDAVQSLVSDPAAHAAMVSAAAGFSGAHRGAVDKTVAAVMALLDQQGVDAL